MLRGLAGEWITEQGYLREVGNREYIQGPLREFEGCQKLPTSKMGPRCVRLAVGSIRPFYRVKQTALCVDGETYVGPSGPPRAWGYQVRPDFFCVLVNVGTANGCHE